MSSHPTLGCGETRQLTLALGVASFDARSRRQAGRDATASRGETEPHYLYFSLPVWYVLAWDRLRDDVRSFRVDHIDRLALTTETFKLRAAEQFIDAVELDARPL